MDELVKKSVGGNFIAEYDRIYLCSTPIFSGLVEDCKYSVASELRLCTSKHVVDKGDLVVIA